MSCIIRDNWNLFKKLVECHDDGIVRIDWNVKGNSSSGAIGSSESSEFTTLALALHYRNEKMFFSLLYRFIKSEGFDLNMPVMNQSTYYWDNEEEWSTVYTNMTLLHIASKQELIEAVKYLLALGSDRKVKTDEGKTSRDLNEWFWDSLIEVNWREEKLNQIRLDGCLCDLDMFVLTEN
ncbi:hypothetical protein ABK040_008243 [Willaertia magna]